MIFWDSKPHFSQKLADVSDVLTASIIACQIIRRNIPENSHLYTHTRRLEKEISLFIYYCMSEET
jgi:hypothetical protein